MRCGIAALSWIRGPGATLIRSVGRVSKIPQHKLHNGVRPRFEAAVTCFDRKNASFVHFLLFWDGDQRIKKQHAIEPVLNNQQHHYSAAFRRFLGELELDVSVLGVWLIRHVQDSLLRGGQIHAEVVASKEVHIVFRNIGNFIEVLLMGVLFVDAQF